MIGCIAGVSGHIVAAVIVFKKLTHFKLISLDRERSEQIKKYFRQEDSEGI
jgi:hypothetical protein